ncbi:MAG: hypothetical protein KAQ68_09955 [Clostridiales bacterium]|nr:hypothetical protein [Clostridiales bacterium]
MKSEKYVYDERVQRAREKIQSQGFKIAVYLILVSMLVKILVFKLPTITAYFDMAVIMILFVYVNAKGICSGVRVISAKLGENDKSKYIRTVLVTFGIAIGTTFILGMVNYLVYNFSLIESFTGLWPLAIVLPTVLSLMRILSDKYSLKRVEKDISE